VREQAIRRDGFQRGLQPQREFIGREEPRRTEAKECSESPCHFSEYTQTL
jgi:hypothetical protein